MATGSDGERRGLTQSFRSQMGYGTAPVSAATKKSTPKTRKFIAKKVQRTDTLMGIALKYAVSVQELKKENKLWNTDHLFLRDELLIPLTAENEGLLDETDTIVIHDGFSSSLSTSSNSLGEGAAPVSNGNSPSSFSSSHRNINNNGSHGSHFTGASCSSALPPSSGNKDSRAASLPTSSSASSSGKGKGKSKRSATDAVNSNNNSSDGSITAGQSSVFGGTSSATDDFFSKYDLNIARLRGDVEKMEKNAASASFLAFENPAPHPPPDSFHEAFC